MHSAAQDSAPAEEEAVRRVLESRLLAPEARPGGILLSVHSDDSDWTKLAKTVIKSSGAKDSSSTGESRGNVLNTGRPVPVRAS